MSKGSKSSKTIRSDRPSASVSRNRRKEASVRPKSASFQPSPFSDESRKKRARQRRRSILLSTKTLLIMSLIALFLLIASLIMFLPGFTIKDIEVKGAYRISETDVHKRLEDHIDQHFLHNIGGNLKALFTLRYAKIEQEITENSVYLNDVKVQFNYPSKISVELTEKTEVLCVRVSGGYALIDKDQLVLDILDEPSDIFPSLEEIVLNSSAVIGEVLDTDQKDILQKTINIIAKIIRFDSKSGEEELLQHVRHIIWQDENTFFLHIPSSQGTMIRVKLDDNRYLQQKIALLAEIISLDELAERGAGELDMTGQNTLYRPDLS